MRLYLVSMRDDPICSVVATSAREAKRLGWRQAVAYYDGFYDDYVDLRVNWLKAVKVPAGVSAGPIDCQEAQWACEAYYYGEWCDGCKLEEQKRKDDGGE